jgi:Leucine-rich repeat (LRR) protein
MVIKEWKFYSKEAQFRFEKTSKQEKTALKKIQSTLKKDFTIYAEYENNMMSNSETKLLVNREGHITGLYIGWNELEQIPSEVAELHNLTKFYAQVNRLVSLPDFWENFPYLQKLNISHNNIEQLPESMCQLRDLSFIDISYNQFKKIPECISHWSLIEIELANNPIKSFRWDILDSNCICYFTQDTPRMGMGYHDDSYFVGLSKKIWRNTIKKFSGYRSDSEKVWNEIKTQLRKLYGETKDRIIRSLKKGKYLDTLDFSHPDFENWVEEINNLCLELKDENAKRVLKYIDEVY